MAYKISDECIQCGACAAECPVEAIKEPKRKLKLLEAVVTQRYHIPQPNQHNNLIRISQSWVEVSFNFKPHHG